MQSHIIKCEPLICGELQEFERETAIIIKSDFNGNDSAEKNSNEDVGKEKFDSQEEKALKTCEVCNKKVSRLDNYFDMDTATLLCSMAMSMHTLFTCIYLPQTL